MKGALVVAAIALSALLIGVSWYVVTSDYVERTNPVVDAALARGDYRTALRSSVGNDFAVEERSWMGAARAPITVLVVIDPMNPTSAETLAVVNETLARRLAGGVVRVAFKYHVVEGETREDQDTFIYAGAARCLENEQDPLSALQGLVLRETTPETVRERVGNETFVACVQAPALREDALHIRTQRTIAPSVLIGTDTRSMTALYGAPDAEELEQALRDYEIRFGI